MGRPSLRRRPSFFGLFIGTKLLPEKTNFNTLACYINFYDGWNKKISQNKLID